MWHGERCTSTLFLFVLRMILEYRVQIRRSTAWRTIAEMLVVMVGEDRFPKRKFILPKVPIHVHVRLCILQEVSYNHQCHDTSIMKEP